jgi:hypothetical protein
MVIHWHTSTKDKKSRLSYRKEGQLPWNEVVGANKPIPKSDLALHVIELEGLKSNTVYQFKIGEEKTLYKFRTCPDQLDRPLRFAVGGDAYFYLSPLRKINKEIAKRDPDFVIVGGDIAYVRNHKSPCKGKNWESRRWATFFKEWKKQMVTSDGRLIPLIAVVGNHDVKARDKNALFYTLFAFSEEGLPYRVLDFGSYFSLFLLDTGHTCPIDGDQQEWLKRVLLERKNVPYKMATYHVAAYPSVYAYKAAVPTKIRTHWVPLFEEHGIQFAFENHNHAYKRTHPIKGGKIDPKGVVYLGDGSWGVNARKPKSRWYLAKTAQTNFFWMVTLDQEGYSMESISQNGKVIEKL